MPVKSPNSEQLWIAVDPAFAVHVMFRWSIAVHSGGAEVVGSGMVVVNGPDEVGDVVGVDNVVFVAVVVVVVVVGGVVDIVTFIGVGFVDIVSDDEAEVVSVVDVDA